jgi:hypothetical protein
MGQMKSSVAANLRLAKALWPNHLTPALRALLRALVSHFQFSVAQGDLLLLEYGWYVTHSGLLRFARRKGCVGIDVQPVRDFCDPEESRWAFKATVYKSYECKGFVGFGDADPTNVSSPVRGAEMRVAETRAVNRALRKAYGIGICSVEEIGPVPVRARPEPNFRKLPPQPVNGNGEPKLRDQLCLLIRQHGLDALQVKQYAAEFCGTHDIRQAGREQIQLFISHLAELATKNHDALLCKLNSYGQKPEAGAA